MPKDTENQTRKPRSGNLIMPAERSGFQGPLIKPRELPPIKKAGFFGFSLLIGLILLTFAPILQSNDLWSSYDQGSRSLHSDLEHWSDAWSIEHIRAGDPISLTSYFVERALPCNPAIAYHAINILLHLAAAIVLLMLLQSMNLPGALASTLIFALHPATVQTLFWSGYRHEITGLLAILIALNFCLRSHHSATYLMALALTALACLMHPAAYAIPLILAGCILLEKRNFKLTQYNRVLPIFCICLFLGVWLAAQPHTNGAELSGSQRLHLAAHNIQFYLKQTIAPINGALFHPAPDLSERNLNTDLNLLPFLLFVPFFTLALFKIKRKWSRAVIMGLASYLALIIPGLLSVGQFLDGSLALEEHGLYIGLPVLIALIISGLAGIARRSDGALRTLWAIGISLVIIIEAGITSSYTHAISQPSKMWQMMADQWPQSWIPKAAYIETLNDADSHDLQKQELIDLLEEVLQQQPDMIDMRIQLARSLRDAEQPTNALKEYRRALRAPNVSQEFIQEAANFYESLGLSREAENTRKRVSGNMPESQQNISTTEQP